MNENLINDVNKKLENLSKRCDTLEKENINYKKMLQINQDNILNLLEQIKYLRYEYKKQIIALQDKFIQQIQNKSQLNHKDKNEIIIDNEKNDLFDFKKLKEEINDMVHKQLKNFKSEVYLNVGKIISEEKNDKKVDIIK